VSRQQVSAGEPGDLTGFPVWHVLAGSTMCRVTSAPGPWWFSSDGSGRFDLSPPRGTCYLADDPGVALLESLGASASAPVVSPARLADLRLWTVPVPRQCDAGDLTARKARGFGVTAELATVATYGLPQRWARALAAAGFGGVRYRSRHDPAGGRCLGLFGPAGERRTWKRGRPVPILPLAEQLLAPAGVAVAEPPASTELGPVLE
jgi:hypothetical protein